MRRILMALTISFMTSGLALGAALSVKDEMKTVVEPATNTIFAVGGEVDPANGPEAAKTPAARWEEALQAAHSLTKAAADLNGPQKRPGDTWTKSGADFARLAGDAARAAEKKDGAGLSAAANGLGDTCTACHSKYKSQTGA